MAMFGHLRPRTSTSFRIRDLTSVFRSRKPTAYAGTVRNRRAVAQTEGTAFRVDGETLMLILRQSPSLSGCCRRLRKSWPCR